MELSSSSGSICQDLSAPQLPSILQEIVDICTLQLSNVVVLKFTMAQIPDFPAMAQAITSYSLATPLQAESAVQEKIRFDDFG